MHSARPPLVLYSEPMSPLIHTEMGVSKRLVCAKFGVPFIYIGSPMLGSNGPTTLPGILVQANAESLSGLVIFQKKYPGGSDSKTLDAQAVVEASLSIYLATLNGCNLIHDYGCLESGLTSSFESILFVDEIIDMVKYMMRSFEVDDEAVALDVIDRVGPGGYFLLDTHNVE